MAHRYPQDVKGLILVDTPTDDPHVGRPLFEARYFRLAKVAKSKGMQAVIDHSTEAWVRIVSGQSKPEDYDQFAMGVTETISMNPGNRDRLLAMDTKQFAAIMEKWGNWCSSERLYLSGLSDAQVRHISAPALIAHEFNELHPRHTAEEVYRLLPNAEWVEYTDRYTQEKIDQTRASDAANREKDILIMPFAEAFLQRIESIQ